MEIWSKIDINAVRGKRVLVALSGGADSVALLSLLTEMRKQGGFEVFAGHVEHGIRGDESCRDALFCQTLCERLGVELLTTHVDVPAYASANNMGSETAARTLRYDALRTMKAQCGADVIALAHHADDQAETVLMHLLRGSGTRGATGMRSPENDLWRPLLRITKAELIDHCRSNGLEWRTDSTNAVADNPRNALRLNVIPEMQKIYPGTVKALGRFAETAAREDRLLERLTDEAERQSMESGPYGLRWNDPQKLDEALLRRSLKRHFPELDAAAIDRIAALQFKERGNVDVLGLRFERTPTALYALVGNDETQPVPLKLDGKTEFGGGAIVACPSLPVPVKNDPYRQVLNGEALIGAVIRTRRDGDRMHPLGASGSRLLSDVLIDKKIDRPLRDSLPLVAKGDRILWAIGVAIAEEVRITGQEKDAIQLIWMEDNENEK